MLWELSVSVFSASCPSNILHWHRLWPFWMAGGSLYQFGLDWNLSINCGIDCRMNCMNVQTLMIPWGWTQLTLVIAQHFLHQKHRVLVCVTGDAVSSVFFYWSIDAFGFISNERCSCAVSRPYSSAIENVWKYSASHWKFYSCFCVGDSTVRTVLSHALTRCQVRTSLSVLCLPLYRFQPHLHTGGQSLLLWLQLCV